VRVVGGGEVVAGAVDGGGVGTVDPGLVDFVGMVVVVLVLLGEGVVVVPAPATWEGDVPGVEEIPGNDPSVGDADLVWNVSTAASPAMVPPMTIGVRFINPVSRECAFARTRTLLREFARVAPRV
jgi:hypothetical protein